MNQLALQQVTGLDYNKRLILAFILLALALFLLPAPAYAQTMPWETFSCKLATTMTSPWIKWMAVTAIAVGGLMYGLGEMNGPFAKILQILGGFSVALGAVGIAGVMLPGGTLGSCS